MLRRGLFHLFFLITVAASIVTGSFVARVAVHQAAAQEVQLPHVRNPRLELLHAGEGFTGGRAATPRDVRLVVADFIRFALGLVGIVMLLLMLYAGYLWFSARGDEEQVAKAKVTIRNAVVGLFLIMMTYSLVTFIFRSVFAPAVRHDEGLGGIIDAGVEAGTDTGGFFGSFF